MPTVPNPCAKLAVRGALAAALLFIAATWGCARNAHTPDAGRPVTAVARTNPAANGGMALGAESVARPSVSAAAPRAWRTAYDWDGDGENDKVGDRFSGGAHCCYTIGVRLSSRKRMVWLPFWMDGGYAFPMDLPDIPEQFFVGRTSQGLPEMRIEIATYNGSPAPFPKSWRDRYGVRSHHIGVSFPHGEVRVRNLSKR